MCAPTVRISLTTRTKRTNIKVTILRRSKLFEMVPIFGSSDMFVWIQSAHSVAGTHHCLHPQWASFGRLIASSSILARLAGQVCEHPLLVDLLACFRFWTSEFKRQVPLENGHQAVIIGCHICLRQMPSIFMALYCCTLLSSICKGRSAPCRKSCGARPAAESINETSFPLLFDPCFDCLIDFLSCHCGGCSTLQCS